MKKALRYNEYGAPIQRNPMWCDFLSWVLRKISGLFYPKHRSIYIWLQAKAYAWGDIQCYTDIKGYKS